MKYCTSVILLAVVAGGLAAGMRMSDHTAEIGLLSTARADTDGENPTAKKPPGLPPLTVDRGAPLLLEEPEAPDPWATPEGPKADNSACFVCHTNYDEEPMAVLHQKKNVGCIKCHGQSFAHRDDEDNITPPDVMFSAKTINSSCGECHDTHDAPARKVIAKWQERCPAKTNPRDLVCTDCHGQHRLKFRTVWWDKETRKLIIRDKERVKMAPDLTNPGVKKESPLPPSEQME